MTYYSDLTISQVDRTLVSEWYSTPNSHNREKLAASNNGFLVEKVMEEGLRAKSKDTAHAGLSLDTFGSVPSLATDIY